MRARGAIQGSRGQRTRGFTLLELLAALALISMVSALGLSRVSLFTTRARLDAFVSEFRAFDAHARLRARTAGPVRVAYDPIKRVFEATDLETGERTSRLGIADEFHVVFTIDDPSRSPLSQEAHATSYRIDREGRSLDAEIVVTLQDQTKRIAVDGLLGTSRVREKSAESAP